MQRRAIPVVVLAAASAALLGACSGSTGGTGSTQAPPAVTSTPTPTSMADQALPLDAYRLSASDTQTVTRARGLLVQDCMRRLGFSDYVVAAAPSRPKAADQAGVFGFLDADRAAQYGFHDPTASSTKDSPPSGAHQDTREELAALSGLQAPGSTAKAGGSIPSGGCTGEAVGKLRGSAPGPSVSNNLVADAYNRTVSDSRVAAATQRWSECMKAAGHPYRAPSDLATEAWGPTPTPSEIATAKSDVACTKQTNLAGIALGVQRAIQQQLIDQNKQKLDAEKATLADQLRKASDVLQGHAG